MTGTLKKSLQHLLSTEELASLVGAYEVVGDIAIISVPSALVEKARVIGETLLAANRRIRVVAKRDGIHGGEFRTRPLRIIAGENRTETEVKEFGVRLLLDIGQVYYSVRSSQERWRVAAQVLPGESVLVLFSGVAPYPLVIAAHARPQLVVGVEKNLAAHRYGLENLRRNHRLHQVHLYHGDARLLPQAWRGRFDRVVMPLPKNGETFLPAALAALAEDGWLHFYDMQAADREEVAVAKVARACSIAERRLLAHTVVRCGHCGPRTYRLCIDARIAA